MKKIRTRVRAGKRGRRGVVITTHARAGQKG